VHQEKEDGHARSEMVDRTPESGRQLRFYFSLRKDLWTKFITGNFSLLREEAINLRGKIKFGKNPF